MESNSYRALNQKKIINLFIGGENYFPYLSLSAIDEFHNMFGNTGFLKVDDNGNNVPRFEAMRMFFDYIHSTSQTMEFLNYYIFNSDLEPSIEYIYQRINDEYGFDLEGVPYDSKFPERICNISTLDYENRQIIREYVIDCFLDRLNYFLEYFNVKFIRKGKIITSNQESDFYLISSDIEIDGDLRTLIDKAKESLKSEDYASVMTKSKSIVEAEFKNILKRKNVDYSDFSKNFNNLRSAVNAQLGMVKQGSWEKHAKQLVKGINITFDTLLDLRNSFSDSHGGNDYSKIKKAEATLALNAAISLSEYYENIYERQQKKLS